MFCHIYYYVIGADLNYGELNPLAALKLIYCDVVAVCNSRNEEVNLGCGKAYAG